MKRLFLLVTSLLSNNTFSSDNNRSGEALRKYEAVRAETVQILLDGIAFMESGNLNRAQEQFLMVHDIQFRKFGAIPIDLFIGINLNFGFVHARRNEYDQALHFYFIALAVAKQEADWFKVIGSEQNILVPASFDTDQETANILTSIALAYDNSGRITEARKFYAEEIIIRSQRKDMVGLANVWRYICVGAHRRNDWVQLHNAGINLLAAVDGHKDVEKLQIDGLEFVALSHVNMGNIDDAKSFFQRAIIIGKTINDPRIEKYSETVKSLEQFLNERPGT